ncbi:26435_t:CDS:1, partial [Dentiscutata erythropus]
TILKVYQVLFQDTNTEFDDSEIEDIDNNEKDAITSWLPISDNDNSNNNNLDEYEDSYNLLNFDCNINKLANQEHLVKDKST